MSEQKNDNKTQTIRFGIGNKQIIANNTYDNCVVFCVEGKDYKTNKLTEKQIDELFDKGLLKRFCEEIADKVVDKLSSNEELACLLKDAVNDAIENKGKSLQNSLDDYAKYVNNRLDKIKTTLEGLRGTTEEGFKNTNQKLNDILAKLNKEGNNASTAQSTQTKGESEAAGDNGKQFQNALTKKLTSEYGINISSAEVDENGSCNITICGKVKEIPAHKFENIKGIAQVIIEDGVTSIGSSAFMWCTGLTSITIPDSVTSIGNQAFYHCSGLTSITIPDSVTSIGRGAFDECYNLTDVYYQGDLSGWSEIEFSNDSANPMHDADNLYINGELLQGEVVIPEGTEKIGDYVFFGSGLTSITIPDSVTSIGSSAFSGCTGLTSIVVEDSNTVYHSAGNCLIETATKTLILGCKTSVIPDDGSVTSIGKEVFSQCSGLTSITIPDSVTSIGSYAFYDCSGLTSVKIPDSVTSIGSSAFEDCSGLTSITIPDSVTSIGEDAFRGCSGLTSLKIPDSVTSIGDWAFSGCRSLTSIIIPDSVTSIGDWAFDGCSGLTSLKIPDSVTSIGKFAFSGCSGLTSVTIPDSVTSIGEGAFDECSGLTSITIPFVGEKLDGTGKMSFDHIFGIDVPDSLKEVVITGGASIGERAFMWCTGLTSVTIPDSVTRVGNYAFSECSGLTSITIPNSVTSIGSSAFKWCTGLTSIVVEDGNPVYHSAGNCIIETATKTLIAGCKTSIIPDDGSVTSIGKEVFSRQA